MKKELQTHHKSTVQSFEERSRATGEARQGQQISPEITLAGAGATHVEVYTTHSHVLKIKAKLSIVAQACNPTVQKSEAGGSQIEL